VQAYCKNLPSDHGQLAGIIKLNPRRRGDSFFFTNRRCGAALPVLSTPYPRRQALPLAREGIKTPSSLPTNEALEGQGLPWLARTALLELRAEICREPRFLKCERAIFHIGS
jgi:hypothetical protein